MMLMGRGWVHVFSDSGPCHVAEDFYILMIPIPCNLFSHSDYEFIEFIFGERKKYRKRITIRIFRNIFMRINNLINMFSCL